MSDFATAIDALVDEHEVVVIGLDRAEYRAAEIGLGFDGRMIYCLDSLREVFMARNGWSYEEAQEWIDSNVACTPYVRIVET